MRKKEQRALYLHLIVQVCVAFLQGQQLDGGLRNVALQHLLRNVFVLRKIRGISVRILVIALRERGSQ